jgi:hypothetical protein
VQGWTITDLRPSSDPILYPVNGTLWEATATAEAIQGTPTPIVSNLNARSKSGQTYRVLFGVASPQGVNPATLGQGEKTTGKVYFDVTGDAPDAVVYSAGDQDLLAWVPTPAAAPAATAPGTPLPASAEAAPGAPLPVGSQGTPLPAGSQGTPLPAGAQGTPLPAGSQGTPATAVTPPTPVTTVPPAPTA